MYLYGQNLNLKNCYLKVEKIHEPCAIYAFLKYNTLNKSQQQMVPVEFPNKNFFTGKLLSLCYLININFLYQPS